MTIDVGSVWRYKDNPKSEIRVEKVTDRSVQWTAWPKTRDHVGGGNPIAHFLVIYEPLQPTLGDA